MTDLAANRHSYDDLHYVGRTHRYTHPDWLSAMGWLRGMRPAPAERCRVLELACGDGTNLVAMASQLPGSTFHGIDLAAKPLELGRERIAALGLTNVTLAAQDLMEFPADAGEYDYIVAHGLYSWCPPAVSDRLLALCRAHLSPQGIAFISFNAYPGYHFKDLQRQLMLYHLAHTNADSALGEVTEALGALAFVARAQPGKNHYRMMLDEAHTLYEKHVFGAGGAGQSWFQHDLLSRYNVPVYFHQFAAQAGSHGLQYVGDAELRELRATDLPPEVLQVLAAFDGDVIAREQYLDFILCVPFRQALLCRDDAALDRTLGPTAMRGLGVAGPFTSEGTAPGPDGQPVETFSNPRGKLTVGHESARRALRQIGAEWPRAVPFEELLAGQEGVGDAAELSEFLLRLCTGKFARFRLRPLVSAAKAGERPEGSAFARAQAAKSPLVSTLYHDMVSLEPPARRLLCLLDGTRDRGELLRAMREWITSGAADAAYQALEEDQRRREMLAPDLASEAKLPRLLDLDALEENLDATLRGLADLGLLVR